jgi:hypothetical protein
VARRVIQQTMHETHSHCTPSLPLDQSVGTRTPGQSSDADSTTRTRSPAPVDATCRHRHRATFRTQAQHRQRGYTHQMKSSGLSAAPTSTQSAHETMMPTPTRQQQETIHVPHGGSLTWSTSPPPHCSNKHKPAQQWPAYVSRAEQSRAEQSRAEQSRAEQSRAEQSRAEQSRAEQSMVQQV